ncbi:GNAT family N-acetyltransferase [Microscilla marina]|uniref:Acetyltransferase, gnat family n=1 Tax=Microscilla marina ATCC 23134 TaxID=313606 RepID=A1ZZJ7_MICM2|nr:GNAT family N-acetyltransferase [Microscilla marina]EAY24192.1 acetyltransferase, gnat family [Microscilla marina ATCC 23134]
MLTYLPATPQDIEYLLWLRQQTMTHYLELAGIPTDQQTHLSRIRYQLENAYIICWQGTKAGLLKYTQDETQIEVIQIQIAPEYQGKGIGKTVLENVLSKARENKLKVVLSVLKHNPALRLYQRVGFEIIRHDDVSYYLQYTPSFRLP